MRLTDRGRQLGICCAALWCAALVAENVWAAAIAASLTLTLAAAATFVQRPRVVIERKLSKQHVMEGDVVSETLHLRNLGGRLDVALEEAVSPGVVAANAADPSLRIPARATLDHTIEWTMETWGRKGFGPLRLVVRDPFGLLETELLDDAWDEVRVEPASLPLGRFRARAANPEVSIGGHLVNKPGDSSEFFALREYQPGDSIRRINWKASARASKTLVNQPTRDTYARVLIVLDLRAKEAVGPHARSAYVRNVRAVAAILEHHMRVRDSVHVITLTHEAKPLAHLRNPTKADLFDELIDLEPGGSLDAEDALRAHLKDVRPKSPVYFVTSAALDPSLDPAIRFVQALRAYPILVSPALPEIDDPSGTFERTRAATIDAVRSLGAPAYDWAQDQPLGVSLLAH